MSYLGNQPAANFSSVTKDEFSGDGSTDAFTLSKAATTNGVAVFVENVRQEPTIAYAVSGTTLTFTAAPVSASGNNIYVLHHNAVASTATHPSAQALTATTGTFTSNGTFAGTLGVTGETTLTGNVKVDTIKNTSDVSMLTSNAQGFLTQGKRLAFLATKTNNQTIPTGGGHTVVEFNGTDINDESAFTTGSSAKFTVPTGGAGLYFFHTHFRYESGSAFTVGSFLYHKPSGGSETSIASTYSNNVYYTGFDIDFFKVMAVGDEMQMKVSQNQGAGQTIGTSDSGPTVRFLGLRIG